VENRENGAYDSYLLDLGMAVLGLAGEGTVFEPARARDFLGGYRDSQSMPVPWGRLLDVVTIGPAGSRVHTAPYRSCWSPLSNAGTWLRRKVLAGRGVISE